MLKLSLLALIIIATPVAHSGPLAYDFDVAIGVGELQFSGMFTAIDGALDDGEIVAGELSAFMVTATDISGLNRFASFSLESALNPESLLAFFEYLPGSNVFGFAVLDSQAAGERRVVYREVFPGAAFMSVIIFPPEGGGRDDLISAMLQGLTMHSVALKATDVPVPATICLFGLGFVGLGRFRRKPCR